MSSVKEPKATRTPQELLDAAESCIPSELEKALSLLDVAMEALDSSETGDLQGKVLAQRAQVNAMLHRTDEALNDGKAALQIYRKTGNRRGEAAVLNTLAVTREQSGDYTNSFLMQQECLEILEELDIPEGKAQVACNMGLTCSYLGDLDQAIELYQRSLTEWEKLPAHKGKAHLLVNLGFAHSSVEEFDQAHECFKEALKIYGPDDPFHTCLIHVNIASAYFGQGNSEAARKHAEIALAESRGLANPSRRAHGLECMGWILLEEGRPEEARGFLEEARTLYAEVGLARGEAIALRHLAKLYKDSPSSAAATLLEAERIARDTGMKPILVDILGDLHKLSLAGEKWKEAHDYLLQKTNAERAIFRESTNLKLKTLRMGMKLEQSRLEAEQERIRSTELAKVLEEVEAQKNRAEEESRQKSEMLNFAAHDLRNLIWGVTGPAELIAIEQDFLKDHPEIRSLTEALKESADVLEETLHNVLNAASIENGKLDAERQSVCLIDLLRQTVHHWQPAAKKKGQSLVLEADGESIHADLDPKLIKDCLHNLVSNAIKYSPHHSTVTTGLEVMENEVAFFIADEGPGLTPEDKARMGRLFQTLSAQPTDKESSIGVGLAVVKKFAELHGGRLDVETPGSGGSIFRIFLPRDRTDGAPS